jgi:hypothetical protein
MIKKVKLDEEPTNLEIVIESRKKVKLWIKVADAERKNTFYTKRYSNVRGKKSFFVKMPQAPMLADVIVYNDLHGIDKNDRTFRVVKITPKPLNQKPIHASKRTKSFIRFAQEFSDEAGYTPSSPRGEIYRSNNGKFRIVYFDNIRSQNGKIISTPARISQVSGKIEVSAKQFVKYTIPMRMAILLHEYSHFNLNKEPSNEEEADKNGLKLYLGLGYPTIDAYNVFLNVFKRSPSMQNKERYDSLDNFIKSNKKIKNGSK